METTKEVQNENWKERVFLGPLPQNFLKIDYEPDQIQQEADRLTAYALQQNQAMSLKGRLMISVVQAKLIKNYGFTSMDPYVRLRVGHLIYETHTDRRGGKNPHWNKVFHVFLPPGVKQIYIEIYDECSLTMDKLIAWGQIDIPTKILEKGETHEDWYLLSGEHGENQEGSINLVLSYMVRYSKPSVQIQPPVMMVPSTNMVHGLPFAPVNVYTAPATTGPPVPPSSLPQAEEELKQIQEMFPDMDVEVLKSVYDANNGKKDAAVNALLQICE